VEEEEEEEEKDAIGRPRPERRIFGRSNNLLVVLGRASSSRSSFYV